MEQYEVINFHITNSCNYHCICCFGKFTSGELSLEDGKKVIDHIAEYFHSQQIQSGRINFAGGEPLMNPHLHEWIDYCQKCNIAVSVITNGSLLTETLVRSWQGKVSCIGISIDSARQETNHALGRCHGQMTPDIRQLTALAQIIHDCKITLKINTVVSRLNLEEDLTPLYTAMAPQRIKLMHMHLVEGVNNKARPYGISNEEFQEFCERHHSFKDRIVCESRGEMENSYVMIDPRGTLLLNNGGKYELYGDCKSVPIAELLQSLPLEADKFRSRYERAPS